VGGKSWKIYGKNVGIFASINVLNRTYKIWLEMLILQIDQDVSSGTPFWTKIFYGYAERIS
jgi:hypothetical protein